ncbi:MAG: hypothetical protein WCK65_01060 [Rhodospirillaceae bacterium]
MRTLTLVFVLLFGMSAITGQVAFAQQVQTQAGADDLRTSLRSALNQSRQFLGNLFTEAKGASDMNDEQLFGVGVGLLSGLMVADAVGTGGIGTVVFAGTGFLLGKWITTTK